MSRRLVVLFGLLAGVAGAAEPPALAGRDLFTGARLAWYLAATLVTSVGSHMPSHWRHATWPVRLGGAARAGAKVA